MASGNTVLVVNSPDGTSMRFPVGDRAIIGRHPECEVVLTDPMLSRRHCKIERTPAGTYIVEDNKSANGTLLNGEVMRPNVPMPFRSGDTVQIGETRLQLQGLEDGKDSSEHSAVKLDDEEVALSFIQNAKVKAVSEEEIVSQDVGTLKRVAERLKMLVDIGQALGSSLDLPKLLATCMDKLFEVFPQTDRAVILVYGPDGSIPPMLTLESELGSALAQRKTGMAMSRLSSSTNAVQGELKLSRTVLKQVRSQHSSVLLEKAGSMSLIDISSVMCAPLLAGENDLGLLYLETRKVHQAFTKDDVGVMTALAGQIAVVIHNSDLAREAAAQAAQRENLSRFLSPQLVDQMLKGKLSVELGGVEKKGTIFFSDIVGFTRMAAKMSAESVVTLLNRYFTVMQNIIFRRGGSIDKCAGDNIMAHWGVVGDMGDFTASAVTAAVEMQIALFAFNRDEAQKKEIALPPTPLGQGIGLNTGIVCAGNIGSDRKIEFTVIGDAVNLSARLEAMAGRGQVFVGEPCWQEVKDLVLCFRMPDCPAKNVEKPLPVYCVRGIVPRGGETPGASSDGQAAEALALENMVFSLPCCVHGPDSKIDGMVTRILRSGAGSAKIFMQLEKPLPPGTAVKLEWTVMEKPSLPALEGLIERSPQAAQVLGDGPAPGIRGPTPIAVGIPPRGGTQVLNTMVAPGSVVLSVKALPPEIAEWRPGLLIPSDLTSHEQIVRA